jgi:hypothetical protein
VWIFEQNSGFLIDPTGQKLYPPGYAGHGDGKNNPAMQDVKDVGPLPCGDYDIGEPYDNPHTGPYTMDLTPDPSNDMFGRDLFRMHGDSIENPGLASDGCIIQIRAIREKVGTSTDKKLRVIDGLSMVSDPELIA